MLRIPFLIALVAFPVSPAVASSLFADRAAVLGLDFVHFNGMSGELYFSEMMGSGLAFLDYDGDGDQDLFLVQGNMLGGKAPSAAVFSPPATLPLSDRLFRNDVERRAGESTGRFVDVTERAGIAGLGYGMGVATSDFDRDGATDLYVTNAGPDQLWRNNADGTFSDATAATATGDRGWGVAAVFFDFDRDQWPDLFVGRYVDYRVANHKQCMSQTGLVDYCGPLAYEAMTDRLYRNVGGRVFEEVSLRSGVGEARGGALGAVVSDVDENGWLDLYVANDQLPNRLWMNQGDGTFLDEAVLSGSAVNEEGQPEASMGVVVGDLDGDGRDDLFVAHLARETNTFYQGIGGGMYRDATRDSGLGAPSFKYTGFGVALLDFDLDGRQDLFIGNGAVKRLEPQARISDPFPLKEPNQLYRNLGGGRFEEVTEIAGGAFEHLEVTRGVAAGDFDNDGDPDLALSNNSGPARLLENLAPKSGWLGLRLVAAAGEGDLADVRVGVNPRGEPTSRFWRRSGTGGSYASARDPRLQIGLGGTGGTAAIEVRWPGGKVSRWSEVPVGSYLTIYREVPGAQ